MHLNISLPDRIAAGATRDLDTSVEIVKQVGGGQVVNELWDSPLRAYELPFPNMKEDDPDFLAIIQLWRDVGGPAHTFNYFDELDNENVRVRFDGKLRETHVAGPYRSFETIVLQEQRD